jgi:hypothetical protein
MHDEVLPYLEMCQRERLSLQRGMNFRAGGDYSIILMSVRPNAPYADRLEEDGTVLFYEGHDQPRRGNLDPKTLDQVELTTGLKLTENGKFHEAAQSFKDGQRIPERVQVYEKMRAGLWYDNGRFVLVDSWKEHDGNRWVYKFKLVAVERDDTSATAEVPFERRRVIPSWVKQEVWLRDGGQCVQCGSTENLHFDHVIPFSKGGSSETPDNIQLLCGRHNLSKGARIE